MSNKFDYQNMLNTIRGHKISKSKTPQFNEDEINGWNNAIELCYKIVKRRREKFERKEAVLPLHGVVCSTKNTPAYILDNIKFELDGNEFLIFRIAHKGISTKGQIFYNGELGYVLIKNGQTMMEDEFDEAMINTMLRWNLIPRQ